MRKNVQINVNSQTNEIFKNNEIIGISSENLQGKIIFKPVPFVDGACRMYIEGYGSILMNKEENCYVLDILSSLLIAPSIDICFKITEPEKENGVPIFATKIMHFRVLDTIEDSAEIPEQYPTWIETFDSKIAEIQKLEETVSVNEEKRTESENTRIQNEENRVLAEKSRDLAEIDRHKSEEDRISNENDRIKLEEERTTNESNRKENELKRQSDESVRIKNEEMRVKNENERILAEENREKTTTEAVNNIVDMTESYNQNAEEKKQEINAIADGVKDMATAIQFATFDVNDNMELGINTAEKLANTSFDYNENTGELEVEIV